MNRERTGCIYLILILAMLVLLASGCRVDSAFKAGGNIYAFVRPTYSEYWQQIVWGMEAYASENGLTLNIVEVDGEREPEDSLKQIGYAVRNSTDAIILAPFKSDKLKDLMDKAAKKGISVIYLDQKAENGIEGICVYSDNEKAAERAGEAMADLIGGAGDVAMLNISSEDPNAAYMESGFKNAISGFEGIRLINVYECRSNRVNAEKTVNDILLAYPGLKGIFAACPETAAGAAEALIRLGRIKEVAIVTFDYTEEILDLISKGRIRAAVGKNPYKLGYMAAEAAARSIAGEKLPEIIDIGYDFLESSKADQE
ncbi:MAG TPA: sugar ABC transporter substrate-binding protein [Candidatus Atribacteria bacterium]|nr:sugar ABC transporter substrate-binding protein [Candidatus Atribacteria bacterium]